MLLCIRLRQYSRYNSPQQEKELTKTSNFDFCISTKAAVTTRADYSMMLLSL